MYLTISQGLYLFSPFAIFMVAGALVGLVNVIRNK